MQTVYIGNTLVNDVMLGSQRMDDAFTPLATINAEFLVVSSGNRGGNGASAELYRGAGAGAGGLLSGSLIILPYQTYQIQVGTMDANNVTYPSYITGSNFYHFATGGGLGGRTGTDISRNGGNGGSGGGAARNSNGYGTAGTGIAGQGNNGAVGSSNNGGGGGGAGSAASGASAGAGRASSISGTSVIYAKGGEGNTGFIPVGGVNFGDGGSGGNNFSNTAGAYGKQGVVILRYRGAQKFTGGTVTSDGDFTIHTFTTVDTDQGSTFTQYTINYS
jgi:hypothetical protein